MAVDSAEITGSDYLPVFLDGHFHTKLGCMSSSKSLLVSARPGTRTSVHPHDLVTSKHAKDRAAAMVLRER